MTHSMSLDCNWRGRSAMRGLLIVTLALAGCDLQLPEVEPTQFEPFDLSDISLPPSPPRPTGDPITEFAVEYRVDLGVPDGEPGQDSEVRVVLPSRMPAPRVPALVVNGAGAYLFSGMVLSDEDIDPMLPYVAQGFAVIAYETDGCQPSFERQPTSSDIAQMTRQYVASKAGLVNAKRALAFALERFPEIDAQQLYAFGHSSGGKQALLLAAHDERIRGCVAFAPACQMDFGSAMTLARIGGPDASFLQREVHRSMPIAHAEITRVPMLLVYSSNDQITRPSEVLNYAKAVGDVAKVVPVVCDGHGYVPDAGFETSLTWLNQQTEGQIDAAKATALIHETANAQPAASSAEQLQTVNPVSRQVPQQPRSSDVRHNPYAGQ